MDLNLPTTAALLVACLLIAALAGYMGQKPPNPLKGPRMVPWRFLMLLFATIAIFLVVHILTMLGLKTDQPVRY